MQQAMQGQQEVLGDQLGDISTGLRSQDYDRQVALREADINRRLQSRQTDLASQSGLSESYINRVASLRENNLNRNAGLAEKQQKIGRASCRARGCPSVEISVVGGALKTKP